MTDLQRLVEQLRRGAPTRAGLAALWRQQQPSEAGSAENCVRLGGDPARRFARRRRRAGKLQAA